jgi:hypothetical protein
MAPGGVREPLHATSSEHAAMRREWCDLYEDILSHNESGSPAFPSCPNPAHNHHAADCPHCAAEEEPDAPDPVTPGDDPGGDPAEDPDDDPDVDPIDPIECCDDAILVVIVTDEDGFPVKGATVRAGALGDKETDENGMADFGTVQPGTYDIKAIKPGHAPARGDPEGPDEAKKTDVPNGTTTQVDLIQHPLCANVAMFEGPPSGLNTKYFGFDPKTCLAASANKNYWDPVPAHGDIAMVSDTERDGARWVSVAVGEEAELEIEFAFKGTECIPCIENSTFELDDDSIAEVVTKKISAKKAKFKIKGKASGKTSLKVFCDGNEIGWFHVWCRPWATIKVDVACILTSRTSQVAYSAATIGTLLNRIYRQAAIKFSVRDVGLIDLSSDWILWAKEATAYNMAGTDFTSGATVLGWLHAAADAQVRARTTAPFGRPSAYKLYFYAPQNPNAGGSVINIGASPAFVYFGPGAASYNSAAHEMGHSLGLNHPAHDGTAGQ